MTDVLHSALAYHQHLISELARVDEFLRTADTLLRATDPSPARADVPQVPVAPRIEAPAPVPAGDGTEIRHVIILEPGSRQRGSLFRGACEMGPELRVA